MLPVSMDCQCCRCLWIVNVAGVYGLSMLPVSMDCQCYRCLWIVNVTGVYGLSMLPVSMDCQCCRCLWTVNVTGVDCQCAFEFIRPENYSALCKSGLKQMRP